jgi:5-methyltetrahydropteroyltriglutamate--homocysteine methyltransferase
MFPFAFDADVDEIHIETMRRGPGDLEHMRALPAHMSLGVGVIDVKSLVIEDPEDIAARLLHAAERVPADRIAVSTDCGLLNLKREHAQRKIEALVAGTNLARERLSKG